MFAPAWFTSRTPTIRPARFWMPRRSTTSSTGFRRMSSPCSTKPIAITPATSPPSADWTTRTRCDYVRQGRPVVVLRTFSKAHGLAGLRVGYGMGPAELMGYFARMKPAFMVSSIGEAAALAALGGCRPYSARRRKPMPWARSF